MIIVSSPYGSTLIFEDKQSLETMVEYLSELLKQADDGRVQPPFLCHEAEEHVPADEVDQWTDWLKYAFGDGATTQQEEEFHNCEVCGDAAVGWFRDVIDEPSFAGNKVVALNKKPVGRCHYVCQVHLEDLAHGPYPCSTLDGEAE